MLPRAERQLLSCLQREATTGRVAFGFSLSFSGFFSFGRGSSYPRAVKFSLPVPFHPHAVKTARPGELSQPTQA